MIKRNKAFEDMFHRLQLAAIALIAREIRRNK